MIACWSFGRALLLAAVGIAALAGAVPGQAQTFEVASVKAVKEIIPRFSGSGMTPPPPASFRNTRFRVALSGSMGGGDPGDRESMMFDDFNASEIDIQKKQRSTCGRGDAGLRFSCCTDSRRHI